MKPNTPEVRPLGQCIPEAFKAFSSLRRAASAASGNGRSLQIRSKYAYCSSSRVPATMRPTRGHDIYAYPLHLVEYTTVTAVCNLPGVLCGAEGAVRKPHVCSRAVGESTLDAASPRNGCLRARPHHHPPSSTIIHSSVIHHHPPSSTIIHRHPLSSVRRCAASIGIPVQYRKAPALRPPALRPPPSALS
jgi:hypothetical protein